MAKAEVIQFSESWRRGRRVDDGRWHIPQVIDMNAWRYGRQRLLEERREMQSLLPKPDEAS
jgi:hypothetical protein